MSEKLNGVGQWFRLITPILVSINLFIAGQLWTQLNELNVKLYAHATNAEIHTPKAEIVQLRSDILEMRREVIATIRGVYKSERP